MISVPNFNMGRLQYVVGDALQPVAAGTRYIAHVCNDIGAWGAGFTGAITKRWPSPVAQFRLGHHNHQNKLGDIQLVSVQSDIVIVNMIAQEGIISADNPKPLNYDALASCLDKLGKHIKNEGNGTVHGPRFGAVLSGGDWDVIEELIVRSLLQKGIHVWIYDLPGQPFVNINKVVEANEEEIVNDQQVQEVKPKRAYKKNQK